MAQKHCQPMPQSAILTDTPLTNDTFKDKKRGCRKSRNLSTLKVSSQEITSPR